MYIILQTTHVYFRKGPFVHAFDQLLSEQEE